MEKGKVFQGVVVWFDARKGFGFVKKEDGSGDLFVHYSNIVSEGFKTLEAQQKVEYEIGENQNGPQCVAVRVLLDE